MIMSIMILLVDETESNDAVKVFAWNVYGAIFYEKKKNKPLYY